MDIGTVFAAIIPSVAFLVLIFYFTVWKGGYTPTVIQTKTLLKVAGVTTKTNDESFIEDDTLLWKEFKRIKDKNSISKSEGFCYVLIKMMPKKNDPSWEYMIGDIVTDYNNIPSGFKTAEFGPQTYALIRRKFKKEIPWINLTLKIEKHFNENWLPKSGYELNPESPVKTIEFHSKAKGSSYRTILYYIAVRAIKKS